MWEPDPRLVSIVTPCLNAASYLEQAIESVLAQDYPRIEYIVMDGGSTDGTLDILRRYEGRLRWISERDRGTPDAINRGFRLTKGEIFTYLNADDMYLPNAVSAAVRAFREHPDAAVIYGGAWWVDEIGQRIAPYPVHDFDRTLLARECYICQPAAFLRREAFENAGGMDPDLNLTFDYELWMRLSRVHEFRRIEEDLALSRMHRTNKSLGQRREVFRETFRVMRRHYSYIPFQWVYGYLCFQADGRDQFFEPFQPSVLRYLQSLPRGLILNRTAMFRYLSEWFRAMSWAGLRRRVTGLVGGS
jgi:glycosyltransferase involved in cell wall biosynthesis